MSGGPGQRQDDRGDAAGPLRALGEAARRLTAGAPADDVLAAIAAALAEGSGAEVVLIRVLDEEAGLLEARAVVAGSSALAAELQGSRVAATPEARPLNPERLEFEIGLQLPLGSAGRSSGRLELYRRARPFSPAEEGLAWLGAEYVALALAGSPENGGPEPLAARELLGLGGDVLATGLDEERTAAQVALLAAQGTGAVAAAVWRLDEDNSLYLAGSHGVAGFEDPGLVTEALRTREMLSIAAGSWAVRLGQPPLGALELRFEQPVVPSDELLDALMTFAARAAHALRAGERVRRQAVELERSRALVAVVGQAIAQLSLAHTLETAIARVAELLGSERLAVYLVEDEEERLLAAAGRGLAGPHTQVADRLLELARGPLRGHDAIQVADAAADPRLASVRDQLAETGIESAVAV
ncbi:MAG TPA: GAF domain-containing protein, partial [Gaiellaceae bacterium]